MHFGLRAVIGQHERDMRGKRSIRSAQHQDAETAGTGEGKVLLAGRRAESGIRVHDADPEVAGVRYEILPTLRPRPKWKRPPGFPWAAL